MDQLTTSEQRLAARLIRPEAPRILAIDPGSEQSAWLVFHAGQPVRHRFGIRQNDDLLGHLRNGFDMGTIEGRFARPDVVVIETIEPRYGLQMGWSTLDTARWIGRFQEASQRWMPVALLKRSDILRHLGVVTSPRKGEKRVSADSGVRQALTDRFGGDSAIGLKASPGPLYGISKDVWSALAIAVTYADTEEAR
jgi:hypothetical protein